MAQLLLNVVRNGVYIATLDGIFYNDLDVWASMQATVTSLTDSMYYQKGNVPFGVNNADAVNMSQLNSLASSMSSNISSLQGTQSSQGMTLGTQATQISALQSVVSRMQVAGDYKTSGQTSDHGKWLLCDGRAVSRTTYANLFAVLGTAHGAGDGSTTFNLPAPQGRSLVVAGQGNTIETGGGTNRTVGAKGGSESHVLTVAEMPNHSHTYTNQTISADASLSLLGSGNRVTASPTTNTSSVGGNSAHSLMHPWITVGSLFVYTG